MIEFDMPPPNEGIIYNKISNALEVAGVRINDGKFELDIKEGEIFEILKETGELKRFYKKFGAGCIANPPYFEYSRKNNEIEITYIRHLFTSGGKYLKDGIADLRKIAEALSESKNFYEVLSLYRKGKNTIRVKVFRDNDIWRFSLNDCETAGERIEDEGFDIRYAVGILLDFYNNL